MKVCLGCGSRFAGPGWSCPSCGWAPQLVDGRESFASGGEGYKSEYFAELFALEAQNFWFRARNNLILWALRRYFPQAVNFLEIGCGTGFVLSGLADAFPNLQLSGSEIFSDGLSFAQQRVPRATLYQMDARAIPFDDEFDVIGAFDVLEHIEEDRQVLAQIFAAVHPGGGLILTVPQHPFLWSRTDEHACHVRRYGAKELKRKVAAAGFRVEMTTSFVSLLLPLMAASRFCRRNTTQAFDPLAELRVTGLANILLGKALDFERFLIDFGIRYPMGGSLLLVARKPSTS